MRTPVGIADLSTYTPRRFVSASEISAASGVPEEVLIAKFGLVGKHVAEVDEHVSDMCIAAARPVLERNDVSDIDAVVYFGSHWKDYLVWQAAPKIQDALGIEGFSLELINVSAGAPVALKVVADMLSADENLDNVLLVGASKESHLVDFANERGRFMFNFGDGAVAALLKRGADHNLILGSHLFTDGSFSEHVRMTGGGSRHPASHATVDANLHKLELTEGAEMKRRLDPITTKNFLEVARVALERSDLSLADLDVVLPIHMKRSLHDDLIAELGAERSVYLDHFGHMSAVDPLFSLCMARDDALIRDGDVILLLAAGTGYTWAASVVRWGGAL